MKQFPLKKAIMRVVDPNSALCCKRLNPMLNQHRAKSSKVKVEKKADNTMDVVTVAIVSSNVANVTGTALILVQSVVEDLAENGSLLC
jgi:hypothetical protein